MGPRHGAPPFAAGVSTVRFLVWPEAQVHGEKALQLLQTQFTGQACALQLCVSVALPLQGAPPFACETLIPRLLFCVPPPQDAEQAS